MAPKTERIEMRTDPETSELLVRAAATCDVSVSAFVLGAARREAARVLARADQTIMPADQFDEMMQALDVPDEPTKLADLATRQRKFRRR